MNRLIHMVRGIHSGKSLYDGLRKRISSRLAERQFRNIPRSRREHCWCGGGLRASNWHASYGVCTKCGCYVNQHPPLITELSRLYSFDLYWQTRQQLKGHPTIEHRPANDRSDGRVDYWIGLIERYGPPAGQVAEIGCAHGVLLAELKARGYECVGVEPDERTAHWTRENMGVHVHPGFFPDVDLPRVDLLLAFDVLEHSPDPERFIKRGAELLNPDGVAIIQTPIDRYDYEPPFGWRFEAAFDDIEHLFLFTDKSMQKLAHHSGLEIVNMTERLWLHHEICIFRKRLC